MDACLCLRFIHDAQHGSQPCLVAGRSDEAAADVGGAVECFVCFDPIPIPLANHTHAAAAPGTLVQTWPGTAAPGVVKCTACSANPYHLRCAATFGAKCYQCRRNSVAAWPFADPPHAHATAAAAATTPPSTRTSTATGTPLQQPLPRALHRLLSHNHAGKREAATLLEPPSQHGCVDASQLVCTHVPGTQAPGAYEASYEYRSR